MYNFLKKNRLVLLISILIIVACGAAIFYILYTQKTTDDTPTTIKKPVKKVSKPVETQTTTAQKATSPVIVNRDEGTTWTAAAKLANPNIFAKPADEYSCDINQSSEFYQIGTDRDGAKILFVEMSCSPSQAWIIMRQLNGKYEFVSRQSDNYKNSDITQAQILSNPTLITNNTTSFYETLSLPSSLMTDGDHKFNLGNRYSFIDDPENLTFFEQTTYGPIYKYLAKTGADSPLFQNRAFYLKTAPSIYFGYNLDNPLLTKDYNFDIQVTGIAKPNYSNGTSGCGFMSGSTSVLISPTDIANRITKVGQGSDGTPVYAFNSVTDPVIKSIYDEYAKYNEGAENLVTINQFFTNKAIVLYQDAVGDYVILTEGEYVISGGCGKPVIYLYPEKTTKVSVKVDAKIVKSDPLYNNGWNVTASSNGQLLWNGKTFNSLYWEGYGHEYPTANKGFVVKQSDLVSTLNQHLDKLGLNAKEKQDFLDFWLPKLPNSPYLRLTWFMTPEMNKLAPLSVSPKPDTTIRIFLDYEALDKPITIKPQQLYSPKRIGFTLVEWGGLLLEKIK